MTNFKSLLPEFNFVLSYSFLTCYLSSHIVILKIILPVCYNIFLNLTDSDFVQILTLLENFKLLSKSFLAQIFPQVIFLQWWKAVIAVINNWWIRTIMYKDLKLKVWFSNYFWIVSTIWFYLEKSQSKIWSWWRVKLSRVGKPNQNTIIENYYLDRYNIKEPKIEIK